MDSSIKYHSVCSSSKVPLKSLGLLTTPSSIQSTTRNKEEESVAPASANLKERRDGLTFPKLTISPIRRFQLLDSDSDDPSDHEDTVLVFKHLHLMRYVKNIFNLLNDKNVSQKCGKDTSASQKYVSQKVEQLQDLNDPLPPAHRYFFHADPKIQKLVRSCLPFFTPLSMVNNGQHQQSNVSVMDFTSQFRKGESSKQRGAQKASGNNGSTNRRNKSKKPNAENDAFEGWVIPQSSGAIPKNAGKRRVHASGSQSAGHWYTSPEGRKVYVTRTGQELWGQMAYRHYRKESGGGFRKSKKKSNTKKKKG
ncbi:uncharacterized protein LOC120172555 [Hibiscus syriacus]|uniref:uncharacterized protein LOC120172555 n=1 Tax=Hibiscus syriacus TaxID=106335 RepID=UPI001923C11B|nr:uncharacterized protein LOC120172555 [Hibiscus syriacus]